MLRELFRALSRRVLGIRHLAGMKGRPAMTVAEVAVMLNVSERHIYKLVQDGTLPHFKVGGAVRFDPDRMAKWLEAEMAKHPG